LPKSLRWLILTDNKIAQLPASIGQCTSLQKVMLAGNSLTSLPDEMSRCVRIELLRISANQLQQIPSWIFQLPKLAWLAFAGNPCVSDFIEKEKISYTSWNTFRIQEQLGEGASGNIYKAISIDASEVVAVKIFKGAVTSDGYPEDEMHACLHVGTHPNLVPVMSIITNHPDSKAGLVFKLIPTTYKILGYPPSFETCTRDTFELNARFSSSTIFAIATDIASVMTHLHVRGIAHGDLYAHNILVDNKFNSILSDFGAATIYSVEDKTTAGFVEKIDVRAFGYLLDDLLQRNDSDETEELTVLYSLRNACLMDDIHLRPTFKDILNTIPR
jgi:serine/threonine protein kinase